MIRQDGRIQLAKTVHLKRCFVIVKIFSAEYTNRCRYGFQTLHKKRTNMQEKTNNAEPGIKSELFGQPYAYAS